MKAPILGVFLFLSILLEYSAGAPVVSAVHVRFVSGNRATEYGHGSLSDGTALQYNTVGVSGEHQIRRRSLPKPKPSAEPPSPDLLTSTLSPVAVPSPRPARLGRKKLRIETRDDAPTLAKNVKGQEGTGTEDLKVQFGEEGETKKGAVKRSPLSGNFGHFPDFDDFTGGAYRDGSPLINYADGPPSQNLNNAESLAPQGLFLPPIPTAASNHPVDDPYAADAESAKYAAKRPPYFHEFPHKRSVLYLNEERVENGLEANILRSIRPFFPFFEINK